MKQKRCAELHIPLCCFSTNASCMKVEPDQLISCTSLFTKATLHVSNDLIFLQVPDKSIIDHMLNNFTKTTCNSHRAVFIYEDCIRRNLQGERSTHDDSSV